MRSFAQLPEPEQFRIVVRTPVNVRKKRSFLTEVNLESNVCLQSGRRDVRVGRRRRRLSILTIGTVGDVSPVVVLARALQDAGYDVSVAAPANFSDYVTSNGLEFRRCGSDFRTFTKEGELAAMAGAKTLDVLMSWLSPGPEMRAMFEGIFRDAAEACKDADAILFHPLVSIACEIAEAKGIPAMMIGLANVSPSAEALLSVIPGTGNAAWNRHGYKTLRFQRPAFQSVINEIRSKTLGVGKSYWLRHPHVLNGRRVPVIYPVSPELQPRPNSVGDDIHFTGYWFADDASGWQPSGALAEFLAAGPKPIYIGFGSMPNVGKERTAMLLAACEAAGQRAVLGKGWAGFEGSQLSDSFHLIDHAPHDQLFRHVSAVVHHGGLGTTSTGLRAGRPTLICPFMMDQKYWGHRVWQLGAGPQLLMIQDWTLESLTRSIADLATNPKYAERAEAIGHAMQRENSRKRAVELVSGFIGSPYFSGGVKSELQRSRRWALRSA